MNKEQLTNKLNEMLVGKSAYSIYQLARDLEKALGELGLDNTQGVYDVFVNAYTYTITYKRKELVSFTIKRVRSEKYIWAVKDVVVDSDFVDFEMAHKIAKAKLRSDYKDRESRWLYELSNGISPNDLAVALEAIQSAFPNKTKREISNLVWSLHNNYWTIDEKVEEAND